MIKSVRCLNDINQVWSLTTRFLGMLEKHIFQNMYPLEDDPRSTPGHSKVLDQIRAIMKLMIVVSTVGLTKKLLRCYVDVQKHLKQLLKYPNQS